MPDAISICERTQPPNMSPAGLASAGIASVLVVKSPCGVSGSSCIVFPCFLDIRSSFRQFRPSLLQQRSLCSPLLQLGPRQHEIVLYFPERLVEPVTRSIRGVLVANKVPD